MARVRFGGERGISCGERNEQRLWLHSVCWCHACEIGPNVTLGAGTTVRRSKLRDVIVGDGSTIDDCDLHDSLIGSHVSVPASRARSTSATTPSYPPADAGWLALPPLRP